MFGRRMWIAGLALSLSAGAAMAQKAQKPAQKGKKGGRMPIVQEFITQLQLTSGQQVEVDKIAKTHRQRTKQRYQDGSGEDQIRQYGQKMRDLRSEMREARQSGDDAKVARLSKELADLRKQNPTRKLQEELLDKLATVLTTEQKAKYEQIKDELLRTGPGVDLTNPSMLRMAVRSLKLTDEQQSKIEKLFQAHRDERRDNREKFRGEGRREQGKKLYDRVVAVLTPAQKKQLRQWRPEAGPGMMRNPMMLRRAVDRLDLTQDQRKHFDELFGKAQEEYRALDRGDREGRRKLGEKFQQDVMELLTDEQKDKLKEMQMRRGPRGPGGFRGPRGPRGPAARGPAQAPAED